MRHWALVPAAPRLVSAQAPRGWAKTGLKVGRGQDWPPYKSGLRGSALIESVLWIPLLVSLLWGMAQLARVSYTYFALHKVMYNAAKSLASAPGLNFCADDARIQSIKQFALSGGLDPTIQIMPGLEPDMIQVRIEREAIDSGILEECDCSSSGCDPSQGGVDPSFVVLSLPDGYPIQISFPALVLEPIPLRPQVRVPVGGG